MKWALNLSKWFFPLFMCKHRQTTFGPTEALPVLCIVLHQIAKYNNNHPFTQDQQWILNMVWKPLKAYSPSTPRKTPQANPTDETHLQHLILRGRGGGDLAVYVGSEYLFQIIYGDNIYFRPTSEQTINFKIEPIWIWWMQDYLFIFLGTQARIFILMCLTVRIFILKKLPAPPNPSQNQLFVP